jgi:hypothetical protein
MEHLEIVKALDNLLPEARFVLSGNTVDGIEWLDERPLPSQTEIKNAIKVVKANEIAQAEAKAQAKAAILDRLGLTADELKTILG